MKNIRLFLIMAILTCLLITGCGLDEVQNVSENQALEQAEISHVGEYIVENTEFKDYMSEIDTDIFFGLFNINEESVEEAVLYGSTGATAEEVAVIKSTEGNVGKIEEACRQRVEAQKEGFENYVPEELEKLETPLILTIGDIVIFVVCEDSKEAEKLISNYGNAEI